jgi:hypothetical protein
MDQEDGSASPREAVMDARAQAEQRLAELLMNAYNETVGGKLDEYPDGKHFLRAAKLAAEEIAKVAFARDQRLVETYPWHLVCTDAQKGESHDTTST